MNKRIWQMGKIGECAVRDLITPPKPMQPYPRGMYVAMVGALLAGYPTHLRGL